MSGVAVPNLGGEAEPPATQEEINRLTGERDGWLPPLEEWVIAVVLGGLALLVF